ncbi:MAG: N-acetylmuramic acid 6-phosphate etherase, partial [Phycisphaerae bacterium]|nr:N-acetylmuramic acid 6-phosphate etherase [Phycisphaerae bacterium]
MTERTLAESAALDSMSTIDAVALMNQQDARAVAAVAAEASAVARAIDLIARKLAAGGRLLYFGAGTSGRLGVLDASECPPTFRTDPTLVQATIAGGESAMFRAVEGAEDSVSEGAAAVDAKNASAMDVVVGIAAGGTTPYVQGALSRAIERGCSTIFITCVEPFSGEPDVDVIIRPIVGPEVLTGSTRLKAGTATKLVLNQLTTLSMVRLGKVYGNLMVDLRATNQKLWERGARIVAVLTGLDHENSMAVLQRADGHVKRAVVMHK